jgi:outer membrane protein assembly factor BamB
VFRVKLLLWIAAWSIWAWLGFGLHRELPRDLGRVVCKHPPNENAEVVGFVGDEPFVLVNEMTEPDLDHLLQLWDVRTGTLVRTIAFPEGGDGGIERYSPTREFVVTERTIAQNDGKQTQFTSLDVRTGTWIDLPADDRHEIIFHHEKPWAAFKNYDEHKVFVCDLRTGKEIWRWPAQRPGKSKREISKDVFFIGDKLGVPSRLPFRDEDLDEKPTLEIWSIPDGKEPDRIVEEFNVGDGPTASSNGRIAWHTYTDHPTSTDVFDLNTGAFVFSDPPRDQRIDHIGISGAWSGPWISQNGRLLYGTMSRKFWEVNTGREIWSEREGATLNGWEEKGRMEIKEEWTIPYQGIPSPPPMHCAMRCLADCCIVRGNQRFMNETAMKRCCTTTIRARSANCRYG